MACTSPQVSQAFEWPPSRSTQESHFASSAQSFLNYFLLTVVYTTWLACRRGDQNIVSILRSRGWKYLLLAAVDVEANYLVVKAYHYTTVTSVQVQ